MQTIVDRALGTAPEPRAHAKSSITYERTGRLIRICQLYQIYAELIQFGGGPPSAGWLRLKSRRREIEKM